MKRTYELLRRDQAAKLEKLIPLQTVEGPNAAEESLHERQHELLSRNAESFATGRVRRCDFAFPECRPNCFLEISRGGLS